VYLGKHPPVIRPLASKGGCQLIRMARGRPSRLITVRSLGAELGAVNYGETTRQQSSLRKGANIENACSSVVLESGYFGWSEGTVCLNHCAEVHFQHFPVVKMSSTPPHDQGSGPLLTSLVTMATRWQHTGLLVSELLT